MQWLRKFDLEKQRWTNQCYPFHPEMAKEPCMRIVSEEEAAACRKALLVEKAEIVKKTRAERAVAVEPTVINKMADAPKKQEAKPEPKQEAPKQPDIEDVAPMTLAEVEADAKAVELPTAAPVAEAADDLNTKSKLELQNIIDAEQLGVKKLGNKPELIYAIRAAREAKKAATPVAQE